MRLTVIGCSGSYPGPDAAASSYLVEAQHEGRTWRVLLDLGNGALGVLHRYADPLTIDGVFLTHLHADHCLDLCGYYVMRKYHPSGVQQRIPVWGPTDTPGRMARAYDLPENPGMSGEFDFRTYPADPIEFGPFEVEAFEVAHPVEAYALRITANGRVLAYSGDTGTCSGLDAAARDADLLLGEASFCDGKDNPADLHLTGSQLGATATRARSRRLVITHVPPWHDPQVALREAKSTYEGRIDLAHTGAVYDL